MNIDWFTVVAQAVNLLLLMWLLKRFLYKPILGAIDQRNKLIATQLEEAASKKADAQKERDDFQQKNEWLDEQRETLLKQATNDAQNERQRLLDNYRKEAESLRSKLRETLQNEREQASHEMVKRVQEEVFAISRKALTDLATKSLEKQMVEVFFLRLSKLDEEERKQFARALGTSRQPALVRSAFELQPEQRCAVEKFIKVAFAPDVQIEFKTIPELICGIDLSANGQKMVWSIPDYLNSLEKRILEDKHDKATEVVQ